MKLFKIEENDANQRLDKFLKKLFPSATRSLIYKFNRKDKIKIKFEGSEGKYRKRDNEYKIQEGDEIKIFLSDDDFDELTSPQASSVGEEVKGEKFHKENIAYEDEDLFIVNKNSGINVHPGDFKTKEISLIAQVQDYLGDTLNSLTFKPSLIHRIDRDTSGILMIAKKKDILVKLVNDFKSHTKVKKTYYAIVLGKLSRTSGSITKKLLRIENARNEAKVQVSEKGQTAITHYKLLAEHTLQTKEGIVILSEVEVKIETGRMHQIRVHMASIGNPIIGDKSYGDKKMNSFMMRQYGLSRQALHAWKIEFFHYAKNKNMEITASLKKDLAQFITNIQK
ncbi:RluA family pseudouridine synthase [Candidatus Gracilibacteria bacterium 28_42_T64]|nr:RluA family pseudouridine synthase [Candidatus Gracilibacteria bacterium 28_42_T64]